MRPIWTRLPNESQESYQAFAIYRDLGPTRTIRKVGERLTKNPKALARLSKKYHWPKRAAEHDAYVGQLTGEAVAREKAEQAKLYQQLPLRLIQEVISGLDEGTRDMSTQTLLDYIIQFYPIHKDATAMMSAAGNEGDKDPQLALNKEEAHHVAHDQEVGTDGQGEPDENGSKPLSDQPPVDKPQEGGGPDGSEVTPPHVGIRRKRFHRRDPDAEPSQ